MNNPLPVSASLRRRAGLLALLVCAAAAIATSPPDTWSVSTDYRANPVALSAEAPTARRLLLLAVTMERPPENGVFASLNVEVSGRWLPDEGSASAKPWLRARLVREGDGVELGSGLVVLEAGVPQVLPLYAPAFSTPCKGQAACEGLFRLEIERQGEPLGGVVEVEWRASASVHGADDEREPPPGLSVSLTER